MKKPTYESSFASIPIKAVVSKDKYLALASLEQVSKYLPNIDTKTNLDLLPVAFNACVVNRVNKNGDVIDTPTAIAMYKNFINKPINAEHDRTKVIGTILTAGFSAFSSDKPLTEAEVKDLKEPFNITLGGVIWRTVNGDISDLIEEASDPTSSKFESISASWELGFTEYNVATFDLGEKNLSEVKKIIKDSKEIEPMKENLKALGGNGIFKNEAIARMPSVDVLPMGIGFTEKPAAEVKGIATQKSGTIDEELNPKDKGNPLTVPDPKTFPKAETPNSVPDNNKGKDKKQSDAELISHKDNLDVLNSRNKKGINMPITAITDDILKTATASDVSDFIAKELKKTSDAWVTEKNNLNTQLSQAQENAKAATTEVTTLKETVKTLQASVDSLAKEKKDREAVEAFNLRMGKISEAFELDDAAKAAIVEDVKAIASDADFDKYLAKAKVLLKGYAKADPKKKDDDADDKDKGKKGDDKTAKAAAMDKALDNAEKDKGGVPNNTQGAAQTLKEKYKNAFAKENITIKV